MKKSVPIKAAAGAAALALLLGACGGSSDDDASGPPNLTFYTAKDNSATLDKIVSDCNVQANGAYNISMQLLPATSDGQREQLTRRLSARDSSVDIMALDVNWTAEFAEAGWVDELEGDTKTRIEDGTFAPALQTAMYEDKLYAAPFNTNTQLLWYRKDLVPTPPTTWDEMLSISRQLAAEGKPALVQIQGAQYEGLVVWFNTMVNSAGAELLTDDGMMVNPNAKAAVEKAAQAMKDLATGPSADPSLTNTQEDQARLAFESGSSAFQLNYPFIYTSSQTNNPELFQNLGYTQFPGFDGQPGKVTVGGINLAVSNYSEHKDEAQAAIECIRGPEAQKANTLGSGLPPTITNLYDDPEVVTALPYAAAMKTALENGSARPVTPNYPAVSLAIQRVLSPPANINVSTVFQQLQDAINPVLEGTGGIQ